MKSDRPVVAHLVHRYLFTTGSWIYHQLINLSRHQPLVLTSALENLDQFPLKGIHCYRQPFGGRGYLKIALRKVHEGAVHSRRRFYAGTMRRERVKLIHAHFGTEAYYNLAVRQAVDLPLITTFYGADASVLPHSYAKWRSRYRRLFAEGDLFLAEGSHMAQCLVDLGCPPDKAVVQHLGVDIERIEFRRRSKPPGEDVRALMAASFREKKGIPYGVEAFAGAVRKYPHMELRIVGGAKTAEEFELMGQCQQIAKREGVADRVHFLGYIPYSEYLKEVEQAHIFLAPSVTARNGDTEGGAPVSIIEASAGGMPVVSTRHCDIPEVVIDGRSGLLVLERDLDGLSNAILELASSPETWAAMGEAGRRHVERDYDIRKQVERLESIYDQFTS